MHILVIGSGLLGTSTAWFLRQHGAEVTVVDRAGYARALVSFHRQVSGGGGGSARRRLINMGLSPDDVDRLLESAPDG